MIRKIVLVNRSGLLLFAKDFIQHEVKGGDMDDNVIQKKKEEEKGTKRTNKGLAGLIKALMTNSKGTLGLPINYMELDDVGVAMSTRNETICVVIHDITDGMEFGQIVARSIVKEFVEAYKKELEEKSSMLSKFDDFNGRISNVIMKSLNPLLASCENQLLANPITCSILTNKDKTIYQSMKNMCDELTLLSSVESLINLSTNLLAVESDSTNILTMNCDKHTIFLKPITGEDLFYTCVFRTKNDMSVYYNFIDNTVQMIQTVIKAANNLRSED